jgi:mRNA-binding protein PUF3
LDGESDPLAPFQRQVLNPQSPTQPLASSMGALYLQALQDSQAGERPVQGPGSFTPDSAPTFNNNTFSRQPFERSAFTPGTNDFRQSSYLSTNSTPSVIDGPYSHSSHQGRLSASANPALLERRLRVVQQEQTNGLHPHIPFQPSALNPYRQHYGLNGYTSPYGLPNSLPLNVLNLPSHLAGYSQANMYQMLEAPRGLREGEGMTLQSQLLAEFKANNNKGNKQWQLKDIQGHVVEFCGDQLGSRFIQTKLETANSDEKQLVFNEILPDVIQLMQDVFGNYVIQKFFDHGDQTQKGQIAAAMKGHLIELSMQMYACRVVQKAIDHILTSQQAALIKEMEPHVIRCVKDMNGNHVIQKAIERIPAEHIQFIVDSFTGKVGELATHCYGCRVIQRVLEYCTEPVKRTILTELHSFGPTLITDQYGNYVTQHMIVHGFPEDRERMIEQVKANVMLYSRHKFASNVVEKCLTHGSTKQRREILMVVIESSSELGSGLLQLIKDQYGNYVVRKCMLLFRLRMYC